MKYMIMPKIVIDMGLMHRELCVYRYLCERANVKGECYPSIPTISKDVKLSESTVRRAIIGLESRKLLRKKCRFRSSGATSSNLYKLEVI